MLCRLSAGRCLQLAQSSEQRSAGPLVQQAQRWSTHTFFAFTFFSFTVVIAVIFHLFVIYLILISFCTMSILM